MNDREQKDMFGDFSLKLNVSQILQSVIVLGIAGLFFEFQELKEVSKVSTAERLSLKEDITELKAEIKVLRTIIYDALSRNQKALKEE